MTDASLQFRAVREAGQVGGVELLKELELVATRGDRNARRHGQVGHRSARGPKRRSLINGRQKARRPVARPVHGQPAGVRQDDIGGQVLALGPKTLELHAGLATPVELERGAEQIAYLSMKMSF